MKLRTGFVSNSSSSSFIIATEGAVPRVRIEADISSLIDTTISTKDELDEWLIDEFGYGDAETVEAICEDDEYAARKYAKCLEVINEGKTIHIGRASNEGDDGMEALIYNEGFSGADCLNFTVIEEGH
jgi:hypothetical protein